MGIKVGGAGLAIEGEWCGMVARTVSTSSFNTNASNSVCA